MPTAIRQSEWKISSIILKKIASIGVWGNGRFPQLNLPSALAVAKQGYSFLFAYWDCWFIFCGSGKWKTILLWANLIFEDALLFLRNVVFIFYQNVMRKCYSIFKKQWKLFPSALAEARSKGILFYLLIGMFWLVFLAAWCLHVNRKIKLECYYNNCFENARYQADGKPMTWGFVANK